MEGLKKKLDRLNPEWRNDVVIQLDGAKYHINKYV
jgi:hypothetical protein